MTTLTAFAGGARIAHGSACEVALALSALAPDAPPPLVLDDATGKAADLAKALYVSASHKGGMDGIDAEKISEIVLEEAGGSTFTAHQVKLNAEVDRSIARLRKKACTIDEVQRRAARAHVARRTAELELTRTLDRVCVVRRRPGPACA